MYDVEYGNDSVGLYIVDCGVYFVCDLAFLFFFLGVDMECAYVYVRKCMRTFEYFGVVWEFLFFYFFSANHESFDHELANSRIHESTSYQWMKGSMHGCMIYAYMIHNILRGKATDGPLLRGVICGVINYILYRSRWLKIRTTYATVHSGNAPRSSTTCIHCAHTAAAGRSLTFSNDF